MSTLLNPRTTRSALTGLAAGTVLALVLGLVVGTAGPAAAAGHWGRTSAVAVPVPVDVPAVPGGQLPGVDAPALPGRVVDAPSDLVPGGSLPERTVRLVRRVDGSLDVQIGSMRFLAAGEQVVAQEADVTLHTVGAAAVQDLDGQLDRDTGKADDALRGQQWNLDAVDAEAVWAVAGGRDQVIAVIDSGVDAAHPDLADQLVDGWSATGADEREDALGHGTHVAGTAAAALGGGYGVVGLAPDARIMPVKVTDDRGAAYASHVAQGVIWAAENGATVVNMSLAGTRPSAVLDAAVAHAVARGVVVVVAAGNEHDRGNPRTYPASHPDVIAVGAMSDGTTRASFSSTGDWLDIAAPGQGIVSTRPGGAFSRASGTSMAAPLIAGAVAVLRSAAPEADAAEVREALLGTARDVGTRGWDAEFGEGAVDVLAALDELAPAPSGTTPGGTTPASGAQPVREDAPAGAPARGTVDGAPRPARTHFQR